MPARVLVVEDDALIASSLVRALGSHGHDARSVESVAAAIDEIDRSCPDMVLLDLGLPDGDGSAVAHHVAAHHAAVPVIVLTARDSEVDVVLGLEAGAVDYVVKPFRLAELIARIDAQLRLREAASRIEAHQVDATADVTVDAASRRVWVEGREVSMRPKEFDLLERLVRDAGIVVTRERLIDDVWDENWWGSTKTLDVHVNSIRRKLGELAGEPSRITTIRGIGYRFERERR
ncbi:MAG: response regulator transcription factor [Ilumatobacteraceae bacterium]